MEGVRTLSISSIGAYNDRLYMHLEPWLLICGVVIGCLVIVADDASAVERPDGPGPYQVGYVDDTVKVETFNDWDRIYPSTDWDSNPPGTKYTSHVRYYYPALEAGYGTLPDDTGAPYATVFIHSDLAHYSYKEIITHLVSHGIIVLREVRIEPPIGSPFETIDHHRERISRLENLTLNESSILHSMVDIDAMGILAADESSTGATSSTGYWPQFKATIELAPYSLAPELFYWTQVLYGPPRIYDQHALVMAGAEEPETVSTAITAYDAFTHFSEDGGSIVKVVLQDADDEGPWALDLIVSFVLFHLKGMVEYETFLYGEQMLEDVADERYTLEFQRTGHSMFPPEMSVEEPSGPVYMEELTLLNVTFGSLPQMRNCSGLNVDWRIDDKPGLVLWEGCSVFHVFPTPKRYKVAAQWSFGGMRGWVPPTDITVENKPPIADPGEDLVVDMDQVVILDGGNSTDTPSHRHKLLYKWSFYGDETEFSNASTYAALLTMEGRFEATLTVRDPLGEETRSLCYVDVRNVRPTVSANAIRDAIEDEVVSFTGEGTDSPSHMGSLMYQWDFGDGTITKRRPSPGFSHAYSDEGTYQAVLWVIDPLGYSNNATVEISIDNVAPHGGISHPMDGDEFTTNTRISFVAWGDDTLTDMEGLLYTWDFGDDGRDSGAVVTYEYTREGEFNITLTIEDDDGATFVVNQTITVREQSAGPVLDESELALVVCSLVFIIGVAVAASTETGKYSLGLMGAPLFTRAKDILDNKTRHALLGIILTDPGIHYSAIREEFGLSNGQAAYHLNVLEREGFIRSARDGKLKRFYSAHTQVPEDVGMSPEDTRDAIVSLVRGRPGISQLEVMEALGMDRASASYYLRELVKVNRLKAGKKGWYTVYRVKRRK
jgi:PKD repeat protein